MQTSLTALPTVDAYCAELRRWLHGSAPSDSALDQAGVALCLSARNQDMRPEQMLVALHARGMPLADGVGCDTGVQDRRYVHAVELLMQAYFGSDARR
ncbi:MAG: hypothetical protein JWL61_3681 [Gemmatimonadetes bacterium]|nr:hypothetical protein [Gemmatimonadota bacterium]